MLTPLKVHISYGLLKRDLTASSSDVVSTIIKGETVGLPEGSLVPSGFAAAGDISNQDKIRMLCPVRLCRLIRFGAGKGDMEYDE